MEHISMQELSVRTRSISKDELILDVRSEAEFAAAHVPGAINLPHDAPQGVVDAKLSELKRYKRVYIHCHAGGRAGMAAGRLSGLGITNLVCVSGGGMGDWLAAGLPVAKG